MPKPLQDCIDRWKHAFEKDENSIQGTLVTMAWNFASFNSIAKAVELHPVVDGRTELNGLLFELLKSGFWAGMLLAIRRLTDAHPLRGKLGVVSLRSIARDVQLERVRLTRRVFVTQITGLLYCAEDADREWWNFLLASEKKAAWRPKRLDSHAIRERHKQFDFLSGTTPCTRSESDLIRQEVFDRIESRLSNLGAIADHATIHFAHASTDASRAGRGLASFSPADAIEAMRQLSELGELIGRWFAGSGVGNVLATPQFDQFEFLDRPLLPTSDASTLRIAWNEFADQTEKWCRISDDSL